MTSPKQSRWLFIVLFLLVLGGASVVGVLAWKKFVVRNQDSRFYTQAQTYLNQHRSIPALSVIDQRNRTVKKQSAADREKWLDLETEALGQAEQVARLSEMYRSSPEDYYDNEKRGLIMGRAILHSQDLDAFDKFRAGWKNKESNQPAWFVLDGDALLLKGKRADAIKWFNSRSFPGPADSDRLMRLAVLDIPYDTPNAWKYLDQAAVGDPTNADVRLFRGQLFENFGQLSQASIEYTAAFLANTNNTQMRDRLASFFRRHDNYDLAVKVWMDGVNSSATSDELWLNALFWTRVSHYVQFDWKNATLPIGDLQPLLEYLINLPPGKFWDDAAFEKMTQARRYTSDQQCVFWLKLIATLQAKNYDDASRMLQFNKFRSQSWNVDLESVLMRILYYRKTGELKFPVGVNLPLNTAAAGTRNPFLEKLDSLSRNTSEKVPADMDRLLRSDSIFAIIFLTHGWFEAALQMPPPAVMPADYPDWIVYGFAQAYYRNHGADAALQYIAKQTATPSLEVFSGEILIDSKQVDAGIAKLTPLAKVDTDIGMHAAADLAMAYINRKELDQARASIDNQPRLLNSLGGKELLAGVDLMQGRKADAEQIFRSILDKSDDAKIYFGKQAFDNKDWATARKLTEELISKYPDKLQYRANLDAINKAEKGK